MDVITTHNNADFDSLGAMVAALRLYPGALLAFPGSQEKGVRDFMARYPAYLPPFVRAKDIPLEEVSRLIIVDCQQASRIGRFADLVERAEVEIVIYDHHPVQVDSLPVGRGLHKAVGSASTLVAGLLMEQGMTVSAEEATLMLLGIHEDTGRLLFATTTAEDYRVASWLAARGARLDVIGDALAPELSRAQMGVLKQLLRTLKSSQVNGVQVAIAYAATDQYVGDVASLAHLLRDMDNLGVLFVVVAMEGHVYLVARSHDSGVDVGEVLRHFEGGGHATAAAAVAHNQSLKGVLAQLDRVLRQTVTGGATAGALMSVPVKTMTDTVTIAEARELLTRYNCNAMPVMNSGTMTGVISRRTVEKALHHGFADAPVTDFMHTEFMKAAPDTPVLEIQSYMVTGNRRFVPVFADGQLAGAVTRTDLMRHFHGERRSRGAALYDLEALETPVKTRRISALLDKRLSAETRELLRQLGTTGDSLGLSVYAVGGFVRDLMLGITNLDIDITVEGDGIFFAECFAGRFGGRVRSHEKFGTAVLVLADGRKIDLASTRLEYYESPGALPTVERASLRHDLYRRDFTINTLALCINGDRFGQLTDHFGGQQDIQERVVRVLHNLSFIEDPTRVFRAIRFEERLGFHMAPHTEQLLRTAVRMKLLDRLGGERLRNELTQIMNDREPVGAIARMATLGLLPYIHPALRLIPATEQVLQEAGQVMAWFRLLYLPDQCQPWLVYLLAMCDELSHDDFQDTCRRLAMPGRLTQRVCRQRQLAFTTLGTVKRRLKQAGDIRNSQIHGWLAGFDLEMLLYLAARASSEQVRRFVSLYLTRLRGTESFLDGAELLELGYSQGPYLRRIKERLLLERLDGTTASREDERQLALALLAAGQ